MQLVPLSRDMARRVAPLFAGDRPIPIRLWAMLDGIIPGRAVVDDPLSPAVGVLQELAEGTAYLGGAAAPEQLAAGLALLRPFGPVAVCLWPGDALLGALPGGRAYEGSAIDFTDRAPDVDLRRMLALPDGYALRPVDRALALALPGFGYYADMYGDAEAALAGTLGMCVVHAGGAVAEAMAGPLARGLAEIGVGTAEPHRRRGLATAAAASVILAVEGRGLRPFWNAAAHNAPSVALARRLGFRTERPFSVLVWDRAAARDSKGAHPSSPTATGEDR